MPHFPIVSSCAYVRGWPSQNARECWSIEHNTLSKLKYTIRDPKSSQKHPYLPTVPHLVYIQEPWWLLACNRIPGQGSLALSQSNFCLVMGRARLKPLKVFSPISWYVSFREVWYFPSSSSIRARIFDADDAGEDFTTADGNDIESVWSVANWTYKTTSFFSSESDPEDATHISLLVIMHICEYFPIHLVVAKINDILRAPSPWPWT